MLEASIEPIITLGWLAYTKGTVSHLDMEAKVKQLNKKLTSVQQRNKELLELNYKQEEDITKKDEQLEELQEQNEEDKETFRAKLKQANKLLDMTNQRNEKLLQAMAHKRAELVAKENTITEKDMLLQRTELKLTDDIEAEETMRRELQQQVIMTRQENEQLSNKLTRDRKQREACEKKLAQKERQMLEMEQRNEDDTEALETKLKRLYEKEAHLKQQNEALFRDNLKEKCRSEDLEKRLSESKRQKKITEDDLDADDFKDSKESLKDSKDSKDSKERKQREAQQQQQENNEKARKVSSKDSKDSKERKQREAQQQHKKNDENAHAKKEMEQLREDLEKARRAIEQLEGKNRDLEALCCHLESRDDQLRQTVFLEAEDNYDNGPSEHEPRNGGNGIGDQLDDQRELSVGSEDEDSARIDSAPSLSLQSLLGDSAVNHQDGRMSNVDGLSPAQSSADVDMQIHVQQMASMRAFSHSLNRFSGPAEVQGSPQLTPADVDETVSDQCMSRPFSWPSRSVFDELDGVEPRSRTVSPINRPVSSIPSYNLESFESTLISEDGH